MICDKNHTPDKIKQSVDIDNSFQVIAYKLSKLSAFSYFSVCSLYRHGRRLCSIFGIC